MVLLACARTTTVTCIHVLLAAEGGSIEPVEPPRYGPEYHLIKSQLITVSGIKNHHDLNRPTMLIHQ